jgi:hypothetical protein
MLKVWFDDPLDHTQLIKEMITEGNLKGVKDVKNADIAIMAGMSEIDPAIYGQEALYGGTFNPNATEFYDWFWKNTDSLVRVGIGTASHYLNVKSGGGMIQRINNHMSDHLLEITDQPNRKIWVSSRHRAQMTPGPKAQVIGYVSEGKFLATEKQTETMKWERGDNSVHHTMFSKDYEVLWYPETRCLCWQPVFLKGVTVRTQYGFFFEVLDAIMESKKCAA